MMHLKFNKKVRKLTALPWFLSFSYSKWLLVSNYQIDLYICTFQSLFAFKHKNIFFINRYMYFVTQETGNCFISIVKFVHYNHCFKCMIPWLTKMAIIIHVVISKPVLKTTCPSYLYNWLLTTSYFFTRFFF